MAFRNKTVIIFIELCNLFLYKTLSVNLGLVHEPIKSKSTYHSQVYPNSLLKILPTFSLIRILSAFHGFQHVVNLDNLTHRDYTNSQFKLDGFNTSKIYWIIQR